MENHKIVDMKVVSAIQLEGLARTQMIEQLRVEGKSLTEQLALHQKALSEAEAAFKQHQVAIHTLNGALQAFNGIANSCGLTQEELNSP